MRIQAGRLGTDQNKQPRLFPDAKPKWVEQAAAVAEATPANRDGILADLLPNGAKQFPADFLEGTEIARLRPLSFRPRQSRWHNCPMENGQSGRAWVSAIPFAT